VSDPRDRSWSDERIRAAYRSMVGKGSTPDVTLPELESVGRTGVGRSGPGVRAVFRRPLGAMAGLAAAFLVVILVAALLAYRSDHTTSGSPEPSALPSASTPGSLVPSAPPSESTPGSPGPSPLPSASIDSALPVITVSQAITTMAAGGLTDTDLLAVEGWLQPDQHLPPMTCPTFIEEYAFGIPANLRCGGTFLTLSEPEDGQGPNIRIVVLDGTTLPDSLVNGPEHAVRATVLGHVHDRRASLCSTAAQAACEAAFVLDQVASLDGKALGPSVGVVRGDSNPKPQMSEAQVRDAVVPVLGGGVIVSMTAVSLVDAFERYSPGFAPSGDGSAIVWYVRVYGPPPTLFPMPGSHDGTGIVVYIEPANLSPGGLRGAAGWGWNPRRAGVAMSDGTVSIATTNWLPGNMCAGVGLDAVLRGSRDDPRVVWLENALPLPSWYSPDPSESTPTVLWPAGYRARFTPNVEIVDASGSVVLRDGDHIDGACANDPDTNTLYLEPPFR
jgi:hypothetical protein